MAKTSDVWKAHAHGPIEKLTESLWRVEAGLPGMSLRRVMTLARRADGRVVVHSAIALGEAEMKEVEAWGPPSFLLVPNAYHRLDAPAYKKRYPSITVLAPRGSRKKIEEVVAVDGTYEDFPTDSQVELQRLPGVADIEGTMLVRGSDGVSVVLNDAVFNMDSKKDFLGYVITTLLGSAPGPRVSRLAKLMMVKDKRELRSELERLAELPDLARLIVSHEKVANGKAAASEVLRQAATFL
ncbi:MAG: hypothetical protein QM756_01740 [Polyangiaceae bacterium]